HPPSPLGERGERCPARGQKPHYLWERDSSVRQGTAQFARHRAFMLWGPTMSDRGTQPPEFAMPNPEPVRWLGLFGLVRRWPFTAFFLLAILSNAAGSAFNIAYNNFLIVDNHLNPDQKDAWFVVLTAYNLVAYPLCAAIMIYVIRPPALCLHDLRAGYN